MYNLEHDITKINEPAKVILQFSSFLVKAPLESIMKIHPSSNLKHNDNISIYFMKYYNIIK